MRASLSHNMENNNYKSALEKILNICNKHNYAFGEKPMVFVSQTPVQDECAYVSIAKKGGRLGYVLDGGYFRVRGSASLDEVAEGLQSLKISPDETIKLFKEAFRQPLEMYLARKKMDKILG